MKGSGKWIALIAALAIQTKAVGQETYRGVRIEPEVRCAPYDRDEYSYPQSVESQIIAGIGKIYGPYTGQCFATARETDIEHIVPLSEAHDSGLCSAARRAHVSDCATRQTGRGRPRSVLGRRRRPVPGRVAVPCRRRRARARSSGCLPSPFRQYSRHRTNSCREHRSRGHAPGRLGRSSRPTCHRRRERRGDRRPIRCLLAHGRTEAASHRRLPVRCCRALRPHRGSSTAVISSRGRCAPRSSQAWPRAPARCGGCPPVPFPEPEHIVVQTKTFRFLSLN